MDESTGMLKRSRDNDCELSDNKRFPLDGFAPSKGRVVERNAFAGAARNQLSGKALPSLIVGMGEWHGADDHVRADSHVCPTADLVNSALTPNAKSALWSCARAPNATVERRNNAINTVSAISNDLSDKRESWIKQLPERSPASGINFPLIYLLCHALEYPGEKFATDLSQCMPIAGPIAPTPGLTARKKAAEMSYQEWKDGIPKRNAVIHERMIKAQGSELAAACWAKTLEEIGDGWISEPTDVTDAILRTVPLPPRYAISEQHGNNAPKIRLVDDFRASAINAIITTEDTNIPDTLDVFTAVSSYLALISPGCDLLCATADFSHAYKHIPILEDQREFRKGMCVRGIKNSPYKELLVLPSTYLVCKHYYCTSIRAAKSCHPSYTAIRITTSANELVPGDLISQMADAHTFRSCNFCLRRRRVYR